MKILIAEDNPDDRTLLRLIVEKNGHIPIEAGNGQEGLELAARHHPDLILSDALMPVMDGFMFLKKLKEDEALRPIPFIFYSATYQAEMDVELAANLGACAYIFKPKEPGELWSEIERILEKCGSSEQVPSSAPKKFEESYLRKYSEMIATKLEQKVAELEESLRLREETEHKLKEQSEFLQRSLDALTHPFYVINLHDYSIAMANKASHFQDFKEGATCYALTHNRNRPCEGEKHPCTITTIKEKKGPVVLRHIHYAPNNEEQHLEVHGYPVFGENGDVIQVIEYCIDITERVRGEEERRRLTTVIEQAADSIIITDSRGTIQYVNPSFERITGYSREEAVGKNPRILKSGCHNTEFYQNMWRSLENGQVWRGEITNRKKDGTLFVEEASITPVQNEKGKIISYIAIKRDVTVQKQLEKHLQQAQKMEAIGTLAGGIAHDFNNILTALLGYSKLVLDELPKDSELHMLQEQVLHAGNRAKELVSQILTFSRQKAQEPKPVKFNLIVKEALRLLQSSIPSNIMIKPGIASDVGMVMADPTQLHQIVMNLCTNAYHAMRETGGDLKVSLRPCSADETERLCAEVSLPPGSYLKLEVNDTGYGMSQETLEKIFDPYFTTKKIGEGTGLGLAIVHGIVKSYNGHIKVTSQENVGTTFHVYLPIIQTQVCEQEAVVNKNVPGGNERILLIDDDGAIADLIRRMLESLGFQVESFTSCMNMIDRFTAASTNFDLIISDMTMPEMTGLELEKILRRIRPDIPIILCTGFNETIDEKKAISLGFDAFLLKPITEITLAETIRDVLDKRSANV